MLSSLQSQEMYFYWLKKKQKVEKRLIGGWHLVVALCRLHIVHLNRFNPQKLWTLFFFSLENLAWLVVLKNLCVCGLKASNPVNK